MITYKLLKELPGCEAGAIFDEDGYLISGNMADSVDDTIDVHFIDKFKHNKYWFKEIKEVKEVKSIYDLGEGDTYYFIDEGYNIGEWCVDSTKDFKQDYSMGNAFLTKEEAKTELQKRKAMATIKKWSHDNDWNYKFRDNLKSYFIKMDYDTIDFIVDFQIAQGIPNIQYYSSKLIAMKASEELEAEYKILFNIK